MGPRPVINALESSIHDQKPVQRGELVHISNRGVHYVSTKYTERLAHVLSSPPPNGSISSATEGSSSQSTISRPLKPKKATTPCGSTPLAA